MSQTAVVCACSYHSVSSAEYPSHVDLEIHLNLVQQLEQATHLIFLGPYLLETLVLKQYGLVINTQYKLLLCLSCGVAIIPSQLKSHLFNKSQKLDDTDKKAIVRLLTICDVSFTGLPELHHTIISRIDGLPVFRGHPCPLCLTVSTNYDSLKSHMRQKHRGVTYPPKDDQMDAQQLKMGSNIIRVHPPTACASHLSTADIIEQALALMDSEAAVPAISSDDPRDYCPWLRRVRWQDLLLGKEVAELVALVKHPKSEEFPNLTNGILHLLRSATAKFDVTSELILQRLNTVKPIDDVNPRPFKQLQDHDNALKRYCLPVVGLLAMLLRESPVPISTEIQISIESLKISLTSDDSQRVSSRILTVLSLLWQQAWPPLVNHRISDPTILYLALSSLESTGKFKCAKDVTSIISKLEYNMRLVFLLLINQHENHEVGYRVYQQFIKEGFETTFNSLRNAQRQASSIAFLTQSLPKVWWCDRVHYRELIYKGTHIRIDQLHSLLAALEDRLQQVWEEDVLLGIGLHVEYNELHDDLSSTEVGYSFCTDPRNSDCFSNKTLLLQAILSDSGFTSRFISFSENGVLRFNIQEGRAWLHTLSRFHKLLLLRFYLTGGSPGRLTELVAMLLYNTALYPLRSLVAFGSFIALNCTYQKTSALTGQDKLIPHALDAFTSDLLIQELAIARPFAIMMAKACYPNQLELYSKHVFVKIDKLFTTDDLSDALRQFSSEFLQVELGVSDWRHISAAFRRKLCSRLQELVVDDDDQESIEALQMGHTRKTDNKVYGVSQEALRGAPEDVLPLFLDASTDWQIVCHVVPGGLRLRYADARMALFQSYVQRGLISVDVNRYGTPEDIQDKLDQLETLLAKMDMRFQSIENQLGMLSSKVDHIITCLSSQPHSIERRPTECASQSPPVFREVDALHVLQKLLSKSNAKWKTEGQKKAVMSVLDLKHDVLAILPTNAGKSMVAIIPSLLDKMSVMVIILPLRILVMDFQRKLHAMAVPFYTYDSNQARIHLGSANLIIVSADRVQWDNWKQAIAVLHEQRRVTRLIIDEAHIPLLSEDFRCSLRHMSDIRCSMPIQLVLLTASGHHELLAAMRSTYAIEENATVIHEPSNRPELRYMWQTVSKREDMLEAIAVAIKDNILQEQDRGIIFVPWKTLGEDIAQHFDLPFYYGGSSDNQHIYESWLAGDTPIIIATSAFGTGNDCSHVRLVVHACAPYEMVFYIQEVSRAGRDGSPALCLLLHLSRTNTRPTRLAAEGPDLSGRLVISEAIQQPAKECIRFRITFYNDGTGVECLSDNRNQVCSRCRAIQKMPLVEPHPVPFVEQMERSKRQRMDRVLSMIDQQNLLRTSLQNVKKTCSFCYTFNRDPYTPADHTFGSCTKIDSSKMIAWRREIRYGTGAKVCYRCHVPQGEQDALHPTFSRDASQCEFRDIIVPAVFGMLLRSDNKDPLRNEFAALDPSTPATALAWINSATVRGHFSNLTALFMWFCHQYK